MTSYTVRFKAYHRRGESMRRLTVLVLMMLIFPAALAEARSVHSTNTVEMFPRGNMDDASQWEFKRHLAFTPESAPDDGQYVSGMIADDHMT